jgi:hypothetical protein
MLGAFMLSFPKKYKLGLFKSFEQNEKSSKIRDANLTANRTFHIPYTNRKGENLPGNMRRGRWKDQEDW